MKKIILLFAVVLQNVFNAQNVSTFAGSGTQGSIDATSTAASFYNPRGVAVDTWGNVYVADGGNHKIRMITPTGVVTTLAGSGTQGSTDATGTAASFNYPTGIAVDTSGNVYVADTSNLKIRKITRAGVVTTLAGNATYGNTDATGTLASFNLPWGVALDTSDTLYVADYGNHKIRKISDFLSTLESKSNNISPYPNPTSSFFILGGLGERSTVKVFDVSGKLVLSQEAGKGDSINVENLSKGIYLVQVGSQVFKIIKQ